MRVKQRFEPVIVGRRVISRAKAQFHDFVCCEEYSRDHRFPKGDLAILSLKLVAYLVIEVFPTRLHVRVHV